MKVVPPGRKSILPAYREEILLLRWRHAGTSRLPGGTISMKPALKTTLAPILMLLSAAVFLIAAFEAVSPCGTLQHLVLFVMVLHGALCRVFQSFRDADPRFLGVPTFGFGVLCYNAKFRSPRHSGGRRPCPPRSQGDCSDRMDAMAVFDVLAFAGIDRFFGRQFCWLRRNAGLHGAAVADDRDEHSTAPGKGTP